jgi:hypothetical protein
MRTQLIKAQHSISPDMMSLNIPQSELEEIIKKEIIHQVAKEIVNNIDLVIEEDPFNAGAQKVNVNVIVMDPIDYNSMVTELERLRRKNQFKL